MRKTGHMLLVDAMRRGEVNIKFTKLNGDVRYLRGTTNLNYVPEEDQPRFFRQTHSPDDDVMTIYDLDKQDWRSFHFSSLIEWS